MRVKYACSACKDWTAEVDSMDMQAMLKASNDFDAHETEQHLPNGAGYFLEVKDER